MNRQPLVSVIIPTYKRKDKLRRLLKSILESDYPKDKIEIIVVVDADGEDYSDLMREFPHVKFIFNKEEKFASASRNIGAKHAKGKYLFFIDDDNVVHPKTIRILVETLMRRKDIGMVGPLMLFYSEPRRIWCAGAVLEKPLFVGKHLYFKEYIDKIPKESLIICDYLPNFYAIPRRVFKRINGLDEDNFPIAWEEIDLAIRIKRLGYLIAVNPNALVWHDVPVREEFHLSPKRSYYRGRSRVIFYKKYAPLRTLFFLVDILGFLLILIKYDKGNVLINFKHYIVGYLHGLKEEVT